MKYMGMLIFAILLLSGPEVKARDGKDVFESLRCGICHKTDNGRINPSLKEIARAYEGDVDRVMHYFQGEADPLVNKEKAGIMKRYIEKTKSLSDADRKSLAVFILKLRE